VDNQSNSAECGRLDSWKEIAEYVGRDVRTAIRWEQERGLPVHRVPGGKRGTVFGYRAEIDRWLRGREEPEGPSGAEVADDPSAPADARRAGAATAAQPPGTDPGPPAPSAARRAPVMRLLTMGGLLLTIAAAALWASRRVGAGTPAGPRIERLELEARAVVARAEDGSVAWRHELADRTAPQFLGNAPWFAIADVDGDGRPDVAASVPLAVSGAEYLDDLHLFSSTGRVLWHQRLQERLTFRGGAFGPPWVAGHVAIYHVQGEPRIAWGVGHHTWWPSALALLDGRGRRLGTFVHGGSIRAVRASETSGRPLLLVGGVSNAYRAAFMAVLDGSALTGQGPTPPGSPFECEGCGGVVPLRYFLFPPSDVCLASGLPYNSTRDLILRGDEVEAYTRESDSGAPVAEMIFRFSRDFDLLDARAADSWAAHEALEKARRLDHGVAQCPWYNSPSPVREWDPANGWRELKPGGQPAVSVAGPSGKP
jgi:hypothetical protein